MTALSMCPEPSVSIAEPDESPTLVMATSACTAIAEPSPTVMIEPAALVNQYARVTLAAPLFGVVQMALVPTSEPERFDLVVWATVQGRDSGETTVVSNACPVFPYGGYSGNARDVARHVRRCVMDLLEHELDELLLLDGERVFDPHRCACLSRT